MKTLIRGVLVLMVGLIGQLAIQPATVQDNTIITGTSILSAIGALRAVQGNDVVAFRVMLYDDDLTDNSEAATCWFFDTNKGNFCVRIADGSVYAPAVIREPVTTPEVDATPEVAITPEVALLDGEVLTLTKLEEAILNAQSVNLNQVVIEVRLNQGDIPVWEVRFGDGQQATVSALTGDIVDFGLIPAFDDGDSLTPLTTPEVFSDNDNDDDGDNRGTGRDGNDDEDDDNNNDNDNRGGDDDDD